MTAVSEGAPTPAPVPAHPAPAATPPPSTAFFVGNPAALGIPVFTAGSIVLGLNLIGFTPVGAVGTPLAIIMSATGLGLLIATVWAIALGQSAVASIFGVFAGFWLSYATLVLALLHGWFAIAPADIAHTQVEFLIAWLTIIGVLTLGTLRLPLTFTLILFFVDLALISVIIAVQTSNTDWDTVAGICAFIFAGLGAWVYLGVGMTSTGGSDVPLGKPIIRS